MQQTYAPSKCQGILSKMIRLLLFKFLIQICGFRKERSSVADWSYRTDKTTCTVWNRKNPFEFPYVINLWISCCISSRGIQNWLLILARKRDFGPVQCVHLSSVTRLVGTMNPREERVSRSQDICNAKGLILLTWAGCPHWKAASQTRAAERFQPLRLSRASRRFLLPTYQSTPKKRAALSRKPRIKGSACCTEQIADNRNRLLRLAQRSYFGPCHLSKLSLNDVSAVQLHQWPVHAKKAVALPRYPWPQR